MKVIINKTVKNLERNREYTPVKSTDTFMSCISFWIYGNVKMKMPLRTELLLYYAESTFGQYFNSLDAFVKAYLRNEIPPNVDAFSFILNNRYKGILIDFKLMCQIISNRYDTTVYVNGDAICVAKDRISLLFLVYDKNTKTFKLKMLSGLENQSVKPVLRLCKFICPGSWEDMGELSRYGAVSKILITPSSKKDLYTIIPLEENFHNTNLYVFVRYKCRNECRKIAASEKSHNFNPYFFADTIKEIEILAVQQENETRAINTLLLENKIIVI
jgi:hypothetical protein